MKMKLFFLLFAVVFAKGTIAQTTAPSRESLLKDPNIWWVGEFYSNFLLDELNTERKEDPDYLESIGIKNNKRVGLTPIKLMALRQGLTEHATYPEYLKLSRYLFDRNFLKANLVYPDAGVKSPLSAAQALKMVYDSVSVETFDPETFAPMIQRVEQKKDAEDVRCYQARHLVYYDFKTNSFNSWVESFAPVLAHYDSETGKYLASEPLFWLKVDNKTVLQDLNNASINWAVRTVRTFDWADAKILKSNQSLSTCLDTMMVNIRKNYKTMELRNAGTFQKMEPFELQYMAVTVDTVLIVASQKKEVVIKKENANNIKQFRFYQEWYWDYKLQKMMLTSCFFSPIIERYDQDGKFLNSSSLFWKPTTILR